MHRARERSTPQSDWAREERAFCAAIGGLGYLGAVVAITYRVLWAGSTDGRIGVRTTVRKFEAFAGLAADLVPMTEGMVRQASDPRNPASLDSIWSALDTRGDGSQSARLFTSMFTTTNERRRVPLHRPKLLLRIFVEWLMRVPFISKLLWRFYFRFLLPPETDGCPLAAGENFLRGALTEACFPRSTSSQRWSCVRTTRPLSNCSATT